MTCVVATRKALAPAVVAPRPTTPGAAATTLKVIDSLKPDPLSRDASPVELNNWSEEFKAFYSASKLDKCTIPEQHAYLYKCLELELASTVDRHYIPGHYVPVRSLPNYTSRDVTSRVS